VCGKVAERKLMTNSNSNLFVFYCCCNVIFHSFLNFLIILSSLRVFNLKDGSALHNEYSKAVYLFFSHYCQTDKTTNLHVNHKIKYAMLVNL